MEKIAKITECLQVNPNGSRAFSGFFNDFPPETAEQLRERLIASGFPSSLAELTFDDLTIDEGNRGKIQKAKAFVENPSAGLFICGEYGTGKTWLAAAVGNAVARKRKRVLFGTFSGITNKLTAAQKCGTFSAGWELYAHKADLLIVDDIGKEKPTEWKLQTLFDLIDERGGAELPTVFTSNYSLAGLCERISPDNDDGITAGGIKDRLRVFTALPLSGGSRRGKSGLAVK